MLSICRLPYLKSYRWLWICENAQLFNGRHFFISHVNSHKWPLERHQCLKPFRNDLLGTLKNVSVDPDLIYLIIYSEHSFILNFTRIGQASRISFVRTAWKSNSNFLTWLCQQNLNWLRKKVTYNSVRLRCSLSFFQSHVYQTSRIVVAFFQNI